MNIINEKRTIQLTAYLNEEEYGMLVELTYGVGRSEYIRSLILEKYLEMKKEEK